MILAGNVYQLRKDLSLQRGSIFSVQHGGHIASNLFARSRSHVEQREVYGLGVRKLNKINRTCVHYSSEEYGIDETKVDPVASDEGTGEAIPLEGNGSPVSPWWQQLPKRWLIVLLCFTAFLLCNMDRVSILYWYSQSKLPCVCLDWWRIVYYRFLMHVRHDFVKASKCSFCTTMILHCDSVKLTAKPNTVICLNVCHVSNFQYVHYFICPLIMLSPWIMWSM